MRAVARREAYAVASRLLFLLALLVLVLPWLLEQPLLRLFAAMGMPAAQPSDGGAGLLFLDLVLVIALLIAAATSAVLARRPTEEERQLRAR